MFDLGHAPNKFAFVYLLPRWPKEGRVASRMVQSAVYYLLSCLVDQSYLGNWLTLTIVPSWRVTGRDRWKESTDSRLSCLSHWGDCQEKLAVFNYSYLSILEPLNTADKLYIIQLIIEKFANNWMFATLQVKW